MSKQEIDWSKAPEGATHYLPGRHHPWYWNDGEAWMFWTGFVWGNVAPNSAEKKAMIKRPEEWNGEGLPPVGTVCELVRPNEMTDSFSDFLETGSRVSIIAHFQSNGGMVAAFTYQGCGKETQVDKGSEENFRPIRTPEQIAAEERKQAIYEMSMAANAVGHMLGYTHELINCLYDAGYRKADTSQQGAAEISSDIKQANINLLAEKVLQIEHGNPARGVYIIDERLAQELVALAKELKQ